LIAPHFETLQNSNLTQRITLSLIRSVSVGAARIDFSATASREIDLRSITARRST
jgi:hypothetical protein